MLAQGTASSSQLTAGPTYTTDDEKQNASGSVPKFPTVDVTFTLVDANGTPVPTKATDLKLFSQGSQIATATSIRNFEQTGRGITAILALDASGSMKGAPLAAIHASIAKFVNQARPQDQVEVITFADQTQVDVPFGASQSALTRELQTVQARGKFTHLWDGLLDALAQFTATQPKRRQIVVISDGHDEGSQHSLADVVLKAKSLGVVIDSIGLTKDAGQYLGTLQQLAQQTGGSYHRAQSAQALEGLIGQGIQANRATPVATFKTSHLAADDKLHAVQLRWTPGNLSASTFIKTPKLNMMETAKAALLDNLWIWTLGGCFVAGVILLILSLAGSRRKPMPVAPYPAFAPEPVNSPGPSAYGSPTPAAHTPTTFEEDRPQPFRAATLPEGEYPTGPATVPILTPPKFSATPDRTRTQLAIFFEAANNGSLARLDVTNGSLEGQSIFMSTPTFTLGAVEGNSLVLPGDSTISGHHARLIWESSILKIEDTNSTNGTYVNGSRLSVGRQLLKPGDEIRVGQTILVILRA
jgi:Mg-chelatase subunit ChlD